MSSHFCDRTLGTQVWAKLTIPGRTIKGAEDYQIDMYFNYKICVCSESNPTLEKLTPDEVLEAQKSVEMMLAKLAKEKHPYSVGKNNRFVGTMRISVKPLYSNPSPMRRRRSM